MQVMLMRLMPKGEHVIVPKGTKFTGSGKLGLSDNLLALNQLLTSDSSLLIIGILLTISELEYRIVVSSANNKKSRSVDVFVISVIYKINSNGPNIDP